MLFSFSVDSDFTFGKNAPIPHALRLNFKNKSGYFNYDFSFLHRSCHNLCPIELSQDRNEYKFGLTGLQKKLK